MYGIVRLQWSSSNRRSALHSTYVRAPFADLVRTQDPWEVMVMVVVVFGDAGVLGWPEDMGGCGDLIRSLILSRSHVTYT